MTGRCRRSIEFNPGRYDMADAAIAVRNVSKSFPGVRALQNVSLDVAAGEVHGVVGANGAGKSTLIRILSGAHEADSGEISVGGQPIIADRARQLHAAGVAAIYQELNIVPEMSALSNVFLGAPLHRGPFLDRRAMQARYAELAARTGATFPASAKAGVLSVANKQLIEIMRAVQARHSVLMDEPTAPLGPAERGRLYDLVGRLRAEGTAIIFISHDLDEVLRLCDRVSVMRDGRLLETRPGPQWTKQALVTAMLGEIEAPPARDHSRHGSTELLRVENLAAAGWVSGASFTLHQGEILGIAGLVGAGRTEILRAIAGADPLAHGRMMLAGDNIELPLSVRAAINRGIVLAPEERKTQGLVLGRNGTANLTLTGLAAVATGSVVNRALRDRIARALAESVGFNPARLDSEAVTLSGGNQQKLVLGKWLHRQPYVLLLDEPTRGIDVGAKREIFATIRGLADRGMGIILVSSDLEEIVEHADTVVVVARGRQIGLLDYREASVARILNLIFAVEGLPT
jgi:ABC-type sugar transport system ATPase subunit